MRTGRRSTINNRDATFWGKPGTKGVRALTETAREGAKIPGYQPIEKLGDTPSFGVWVRAVQTRMDRHVLLKLVPPGATHLHEFLSREIQVLVRRDGAGVVRVIDEGTVGGVRYLVVDEGEGEPLETILATLSDREWLDLGSTLDGLYRWVGEQGFVLGPLSPRSIQRTPRPAVGLTPFGGTSVRAARVTT